MKERVLDKNIKISPDLAAIVQRTFKCLICLSAPLNSPPGYQECCRSIVGCYECLEAYYTAGRSQMSCPKCRADRGYAKLHELLGMEEFLNGLQHIQDAQDGANDPAGPRNWTRFACNVFALWRNSPVACCELFYSLMQMSATDNAEICSNATLYFVTMFIFWLWQNVNVLTVACSGNSNSNSKSRLPKLERRSSITLHLQMS